jgi:hypothetical protein
MVVVVLTAGIASDKPRGGGIVLLGFARPTVRLRDAQHAARTGQDGVAVEASSGVGVFGEVRHLAVHSSLDEARIALVLDIEGHVGSGDSDVLESQKARSCENDLAETVWGPRGHGKRL